MRQVNYHILQRIPSYVQFILNGLSVYESSQFCHNSLHSWDTSILKRWGSSRSRRFRLNFDVHIDSITLNGPVYDTEQFMDMYIPNLLGLDKVSNPKLSFLITFHSDELAPTFQRWCEGLKCLGETIVTLIIRQFFCIFPSGCSTERILRGLKEKDFCQDISPLNQS